MNMFYFAINGDNVGDGIGNAIASDDHEGLQKLSGSINDTHNYVAQWVEEKGGKTVVNSGDEGIFAIPEEAVDSLEELKGQYSEMCGTSCTIGIGSSISEASKALIYGKLNDKDQIVEYDPMIEDYIADEEEESLPSEGKLNEKIQNERTAEEGLEDQQDPEVTVPADEMVDEHEELVDTLESPSHEDDMEEAGKQKEELEDYKQAEETGEDLDVAAEEGLEDQEELEEEFDETSDREPNEIIDDVMDSNPDDEREDQPIAEEGMEQELPPEEGEMPPETAPEEGMEQELPPEEMEELGDHEVMQDEADPNMEENSEESDPNMVSDMVHAHLNGEEYEQGNEQDYGQIKQDIAQSLQTFKQNKELLDQAKGQNPELHEAMIAMMRSMIQMGKILSIDEGNDQHMEDIEQSPEAEEAIPDMDEVPMDEDDETPTPEDTELEEGEDEGNLPVKKP